MIELNRRLVEHELGLEWLTAHAARPIRQADWEELAANGRVSDTWFAKTILGYTNSTKFSDLTVYWPPRTIKRAVLAWELGRLEALRYFELRASPRTRKGLDLDDAGAIERFLFEEHRKRTDPVSQRLRQYPPPRDVKALVALFRPLSPNAQRLLQLLGKREIVARPSRGSPAMPIDETYGPACKELMRVGLVRAVPRPSDASERDNEALWAQLTEQGREVARLTVPDGPRPRYIERELSPVKKEGRSPDR